MHSMAWDVEYTDEFETWWESLTETEQEDVDAYVQRLEARGPNLPYPHSSGINGSRHTAICASCAFKATENRFECSTRLIQSDRQSC